MFPNKLLGQNFLRCSWVTGAMIKAAELKESDVVLEVGAGTGILTEELAKKSKKVIAIEKDRNLIVQYLKSLSDKYPNLEIIEGDILKISPRISITHHPSTRNLRFRYGVYLLPTTYKLISNIPYYLTSRLLRIVLEKGPRPQTIVLTIQKEVAERICAKPPKMSLLALSIQAFGKPEIIKKVPAECFWPKPQVDSAIIKISQISDEFFVQNKILPEKFFKVLRTAFSQKRKMLSNSLKPLDYGGLTSVVRKESRPEELGLEQWAKLVKNCA